MDFDDLRIFAVVARLQSFSRASAQLHVVQSALGRRVQRLERQLGTTLLDRHSRGARPTHAGITLLKKIERLEAELQQILQEMLSLKDELVGDVRLALSHGIVQFLGSKIVENYRSHCPDVKLSLLEGKSSENYDAVLKGVVDAGIVYDPGLHPELTVVPLFFERRLIIGPVDPVKDVGGIRNLNTFPAAKLGQLPLILPRSPHHIRLAVEEAARACGIKLTVALEVDGLSALKTMVDNGLGYTVLTYGPAYREIASGTFAAVPIVEPTLECLVSFVHRRDRQSAPALVQLNVVIANIIETEHESRYWRPARTLSSEYRK